MGRMHSKGKGLSRSALPYKRSPPSWLKISPDEVGFVTASLLEAHQLHGGRRRSGGRRGFWVAARRRRHVAQGRLPR